MLSKCCCCVSLRVGSIILGVLGLIGGLIYMLVGTGVVGFASSDGGGGIAWFYIICGLLCLIAYGALLFGAIKYNGNAVRVYLVSSAICIVIGVLFGVIVLASIKSSDPVTSDPVFADDCASVPLTKSECDMLKAVTIGMKANQLVISTLFGVYFWICIYSFYKELKSGGGYPV